MKPIRILAINPGSTSTKIAVFEDEKLIMEKVLRHTSQELERYYEIYSQKEFRKDMILEGLQENGIAVESIDTVVGRGGLLKPIESGTYIVRENMVNDLKKGVLGGHASNLGGVIAKEIADSIGKNAYIVDPVIVDELEDVARVSGIPEIERISIFHALNQKAVARRYAQDKNVKYEDLNLIIAHLGGGISVGIHKNGKVIDVNNALDGDGPFSPERSGGVPAGQLVKMAMSGDYSIDFIKKRLNGAGGIVGYLGTNDVREVQVMIENGDKKAELILDAMCYQVAKEIGALSTVVCGKVDGIILTGGISYSTVVTDKIKERVAHLGEVTIYPGEDEMSALASGGLRIERGEEQAKEY